MRRTSDSCPVLQVCEQLKVQSQNDEKKLEEAKGLVYLKGFTDGIMAVGIYSGDKVSKAKPLIRQELIDAGEALPYWEPESRVISRTGDECIVALTDQWCAFAHKLLFRHRTFPSCALSMNSRAVDQRCF